MNIFCSHFKSMIEDAARFCDRRSMLPILTRCRLKTGDNALIIETTDLDKRFMRVIPTVGDLSFDILVPVERLLKIAKHATGTTFALDYADKVLRFSGELSFSIPIDGDVDDFPASPDFAETISIPPLPKQFFAHLATVLPFTDDIRTNRAYAGVLVDPAQGVEEGLSLVATDIHRVSVLTLKGMQVPYPFVIPSPAIPALEKLFSDSAPLGITLAREHASEKPRGEDDPFIPSHMILTTNDTTVHLRLQKNEFPVYRNVIPGIMSLLGHQIEPDTFLKKIKGLLSFADRKVPAAILRIDGGKAVISAKDETASEVSANLPVRSYPVADPLTSGVNLRYFAEGLSTMCGLTTVWNGAEPGTLRPLILLRDTDTVRNLHMVMPLRV